MRRENKLHINEQRVGASIIDGWRRRTRKFCGGFPFAESGGGEVAGSRLTVAGQMRRWWAAAAASPPPDPVGGEVGQRPGRCFCFFSLFSLLICG
uniref:Uncharacterized protein n=1 Tax=Leersia perrieri TaxID=77586 RepID=A0A0D9XND9_9ORYZ